MLVGARGWIRLKVFDGTEVVRHHFWLLCIKSEKLERIPGSRASWGSPRGGASVCLPEHGAERPSGRSSWVRSNVDSLQVRPVNTL